MNKLLLSLHVVTAIIFIGPITLATSLFPRYARQSPSLGGSAAGSEAVASSLHRVTHVYAVLALTVPLVGIALAARMGVLTDVWVVVSIGVTAAAAAILAARIVPGQSRIMAAIDEEGPPAPGSAQLSAVVATLRQLSMTSGIFALLWVIVVVMMVIRPGSTTSV